MSTLGAANTLKIRRTLLSVTDKSGVAELARALADAGSELIATGGTADALKAAGLNVTSVESVTGQAEGFGGRMKTLAFGLLSGVLFRRSNAGDVADLKQLGFGSIDCVVVNFYEFEKAIAQGGDCIEKIDVGGPTLVRAGAKNVPDVLVLTSPTQYGDIQSQLKNSGSVPHALVRECAIDAWEYVASYDQVIAAHFRGRRREALRYGENPHQRAWLEVEEQAALDWLTPLTGNELSYTNIADLVCGHELVGSWLAASHAEGSCVAIVKHANPCGFAWVAAPTHVQGSSAQKLALMRAWEGDAVSAFGGVVMFSEPLEADSAQWLSERFVECVAAPGLTTEVLAPIMEKRKRLKAIAVRSFEISQKPRVMDLGSVKLIQEPDSLAPNQGSWQFVTERRIEDGSRRELFLFGVLACRALKSNAIAIVREWNGVYQLVGAGQGQPNRIDALARLAIPRAQDVLRQSGGRMEECVLVSDAFFPFRDSIEAAAVAGIRWVIQPGGSVQDPDVIAACDEHKIGMIFTGQRHFRH